MGVGALSAQHVACDGQGHIEPHARTTRARSNDIVFRTSLGNWLLYNITGFTD